MAQTDPELAAAIARHGYVIGLAGWSGSGKTTLAEKIIAGLNLRGLDIATIKHAHHKFDADTPGKDSFRHRQAGARQVVVASTSRSVIFSENRPHPERSLADLLTALNPADIVLVEGFKREAIPKIEIFRPDNASPALFPNDPMIIAVATDTPSSLTSDLAGTASNPDLPILDLPILDLNDAAAIVDFVCTLAGNNNMDGAS